MIFMVHISLPTPDIGYVHKKALDWKPRVMCLVLALGVGMNANLSESLWCDSRPPFLRKLMKTGLHRDQVLPWGKSGAGIKYPVSGWEEPRGSRGLLERSNSHSKEGSFHSCCRTRGGRPPSSNLQLPWSRSVLQARSMTGLFFVFFFSV